MTLHFQMIKLKDFGQNTDISHHYSFCCNLHVMHPLRPVPMSFITVELTEQPAQEYINFVGWLPLNNDQRALIWKTSLQENSHLFTRDLFLNLF